MLNSQSRNKTSSRPFSGLRIGHWELNIDQILALFIEESDLFSNIELSRRLESAEGNACARFIEARKAAFPHCGSCWIEVPGVMAMHDGPSSPSTQTFGLGLFQSVSAEDAIAIEKFFADRGSPVLHEVSPLAGVPLLSMLVDRGYAPVEQTSVMYRPTISALDSTARRNEKIQVQRIGEADLGTWAKTTAEGWSDIADLSSLFVDIGRVRAYTKDAFTFLAELNGQPIAAASMNVHGGVALMAGACTIPAARKQGAQLALLECRLAFAAAQGCDLAMMGAEPGSRSQRNAERNGFRIAYTRTKWQLRERSA
jgi:hypothetical protein